MERAWRPISMVSSNPAVVTNATRAPLRCSSVLVPTVVPCSSTISPERPRARDRFGNGLRRVGGSGEDLHHAQLPALDPNAVGEGSAGIDGYAGGWLRSVLREAAMVERTAHGEKRDFSTRLSGGYSAFPSGMHRASGGVIVRQGAQDLIAKLAVKPQSGLVIDGGFQVHLRAAKRAQAALASFISSDASPNRRASGTMSRVRMRPDFPRTG